jgi:hypothetical protein
MKKILTSLFMLSILFTGCERDITTEDESTITYYVTFELEGESVMSIPIGQAYSEPGFVAVEGETDVTSTVEVSGTVGEGLGVYELTYAAVNGDEFSSSVSRTVIVYDPEAPDTDISGTYSAKVDRRAPYVRSFSGHSVTIEKIATGIFYCSDLLGGFYAQGFGYGQGYAMTGYISLSSDNSINLLSSFVAGWGDSLDDLTDGQLNPTTGEIALSSYYVGAYVFDVKLTK